MGADNTALHRCQWLIPLQPHGPGPKHRFCTRPGTWLWTATDREGIFVCHDHAMNLRAIGQTVTCIHGKNETEK